LSESCKSILTIWGHRVLVPFGAFGTGYRLTSKDIRKTVAPSTDKGTSTVCALPLKNLKAKYKSKKLLSVLKNFRGSFLTSALEIYISPPKARSSYWAKTCAFNTMLK
jgi:hypothetical protein